MTNNVSNKQKIEFTPETAAMFGVSEHKEATPIDTETMVPANLPIIDAVGTTEKSEVAELAELPHENLDMEEIQPIPETPANSNSKARAIYIAKSVAPYLGIFLVGIFLYQYFFSDFSVGSFIKTNDTATVTQTQAEVNERLVALKQEKAGEYAKWIKQFFYEVTDPAVIEMDNDISGNGLTNFEKFMLNLNPKAYDTLGLGQPDGQTVMDGTNPWTGKPMTDNQKKIVELYFDRQLISNRLAAGSLKLAQNSIANASGSPNNNGYENPSNYSFVDGTGTVGATNSASSSGGGQVAGTYTNQPQQILGTSSTGSTSTGQGSALQGLDINADIAGELSIPANGIKAPLVFTKDTKNFESDLTKGVVHYPGTAMPGSVGTAYISGHSSGYSWQRNAYKNIFRGLNNVKDGTSFTITVTLKDNRKATIHYVVQTRKEFAPNDQAQFVQTAEARVALSTCWPLDTTSRRLVLFAKQTQVSF